MTSLIVAVLLLIIVMQAMSTLSLPRLLIVGLLGAVLLYPLGKNLIRAESPRQVYKVVKVSASEQKGGTTTYEFKPPSAKRFGLTLKPGFCHWWQNIDKNQKEGPIRERIRRSCEAKKPKEKQQ